MKMYACTLDNPARDAIVLAFSFIIILCFFRSIRYQVLLLNDVLLFARFNAWALYTKYSM